MPEVSILGKALEWTESVLESPTEKADPEGQFVGAL